MKARTDIVRADRSRLVLSDFRGVDFSSSPLNVSAKRAIDAQNFINDFGIMRKRNGWLQRLRLDGRINGIFEYVYGDVRHVLVHAGCRFYRLGDLAAEEISAEDITESGSYEPSLVNTSLLTDTRSQAFSRGGRLYIVGCGDYLTYGTWNDGESFELRRVYNDEDTYIPKTTTNIGVVLEEEDGSLTVDERASLDSVNYLTDWRRNGLSVGGAQGNLFYLDASIDEGTTVKATITTADGYIVSAESREDDTLWGEYRGAQKEVGAIEDRTAGKIRFSGVMIDAGEEDAVVVTFSHKVEGYAERITQAQFGILFGIEGNTDRLFLSGNARYANVDFFSEMDDYTYFGDRNTVTMGSDAYATVGYARLSDSTLAVFKEKSTSEASIFYRTGYYKDEYDADGNLDKILSVFPTTAGTIGETVISRHACADFGGDNLILSVNGVFGIVLTDNTTTKARYTRERSRAINARLSREDLSDAVAIVYKNRYYLCVDSHVYVADGRYRYTTDATLDSAWNYEWYYFDNIPARVFCELDGALWFGTADGRLCMFDEAFSDRTYDMLERGDILIEDGAAVWGASVSSPPRDGERIRFFGEAVYARMLPSFARVENGRLYVPAEKIGGIYDGTVVYADGVGGTGLSLRTPYTIDDVDAGDCSFRLLDASGKAVSVSAGEGTLSLLVRVDGRELYICEVDDTAQTFLVKEKHGEPLYLCSYGNALPSFERARVTHTVPVTARWVTPLTDFGDAAVEKQLLSLTVTTSPGVRGALRVGYETRFSRQESEISPARAFSLADLSFNDFSFDTGFAVSQTVRILERYVNYAVFRFVSDTDTDCAIGALSVEYRTGRKYKGVR